MRTRALPPAAATLVVALLAALLVVLAPPADAATSAERAFLDRINGDRAAAGLAPLRLSSALSADVARPWTDHMAATRRLAHNPNYKGEILSRVTPVWNRMAENVGQGRDVAGLHQAFMGSSGHRANILGDFNWIGIAVVTDGTGQMWVTHNFLKTSAPLAEDGVVAGPGASAPGGGPAPGRPPIGVVDAVAPAPGGIRVAGWAFDPDTSSPIDVHVYVGAAGHALRADAPRPDVGAAFGRTHGHGFDRFLPAAPGVHQVCAYGIDVGGGGNAPLHCRSVTVRAGSPSGSLDLVTSTTPGAVSVAGWAIDPDTTAPIDVHVYVGAAGHAMKADLGRPDVGAAHPGYGAGHGFSATVPAPPGDHQVCAYAINTGIGGNSLLGCTKVGVPSGSPFGSVDVVAGDGAGGVTVAGWAIDPDTAAPIDVHVYVGAAGHAAKADLGRPDVGAAHPGYGVDHGFSATLPAGSGRHQVCAYAINTGIGGNSLLDCRMVTIP